MTGIRERAFRGLMGSATAEIITRAVMIGLSIVTARILDPSQAGLVAFGAILYQVLLAVGGYVEVAGATVKSEDSEVAVAMRATALRLMISVPLALVGLALAGPIAAWFATDPSGEGELVSILRLLFFASALDSIATFPRVVFQRRLEFGVVVVGSLSQAVVYAASAVALLVLSPRPLSIAAAGVVSVAAGALFLWGACLRRGVRPTRGPSTAPPLGPLARLTGGLFVGGFPGFFSMHADNLLVSAVGGASALSVYSIAWNASRSPAFILARAFQVVLVPTIASIQADRPRVERATRECLRAAYLLVVPLVVMLVVSGPDVVRVVLGPKWDAAGPCLQVLALSLLATPPLYLLNALFTGTGSAHWLGAVSAVQLGAQAVLVPACVYALGVIGAGVADVLVVGALLATEIVIGRRFGFAIRRMAVAAASVPCAAGVLAGGAAALLASGASVGLTRLAIHGLAVACCYPLGMALFGGVAQMRDFVLLLRRSPLSQG